MIFWKVKSGILLFGALMAVMPLAHSQLQLNDKHIYVALRMVGHQMMLSAGDSTSRVLPITTNGETYELSFETPIAIEPDTLVALVDSVVKQAQIASSYLVEILQCDSKEVLYSYEVGGPGKMDIVPCRGRDLPVDCYLLSFTILEVPLVLPSYNSAQTNVASTQPAGTMPLVVSAGLLIGITFLWFYFRKKQEDSEAPANVLALGSIGFDTVNMQLLHDSEKMELTAKECDLLLLLYHSANETLERDVILNRVWGDEGDYVGRTLDVFISKLRKKLEADTNLKIVNVRGVGYKLILNG